MGPRLRGDDSLSLDLDLGPAGERAGVRDDDPADLRQRRALRPPVAGDARARLVLAADLVKLVAAEREHALLVLAEIEEDVARARRRRGPPHRRDRAERGAGELHEIAVALEAARHGAARAAHAGRLEAGIDEDRAPGIAPLAALRQRDELLDAAIARTLVEAEIGLRLGEPWWALIGELRIISAFTRVFRRAMRAHDRVAALAARSLEQARDRARQGRKPVCGAALRRGRGRSGGGGSPRRCW